MKNKIKKQNALDNLYNWALDRVSWSIEEEREALQKLVDRDMGILVKTDWFKLYCGNCGAHVGLYGIKQEFNFCQNCGYKIKVGR